MKEGAYSDNGRFTGIQIDIVDGVPALSFIRDDQVRLRLGPSSGAGNGSYRIESLTVSHADEAISAGDADTVDGVHAGAAGAVEASKLIVPDSNKDLLSFRILGTQELQAFNNYRLIAAATSVQAAAGGATVSDATISEDDASGAYRTKVRVSYVKRQGDQKVRLWFRSTVTIGSDTCKVRLDVGGQQASVTIDADETDAERYLEVAVTGLSNDTRYDVEIALSSDNPGDAVTVSRWALHVQSNP